MQQVQRMPTYLSGAKLISIAFSNLHELAINYSVGRSLAGQETP